MKKQLTINKETLRKLEEDSMEKVVGGWKELPNLTKNCDNTTVGACGRLTNCQIGC